MANIIKICVKAKRELHTALRPGRMAYTFTRTLALLQCILTLSCTPRVPKPIPLKKEELTKIKVAALHIQVPEGDVIYSRALPRTPLMGSGSMADIIIVPTCLAFQIVEAGIASSKDRQPTERLQGVLDKLQPRQILAAYFMMYLKRAGVFERLECVEEVTPSSLAVNRYDSIIDLNMSDVSLRRERSVNTLRKVEDTLRLYIRVDGSMRRVVEDEVIWQGIETFVSPQAYTLDAYMAENGKLLQQDIDIGLQHIAVRLAKGILYPKE